MKPSPRICIIQSNWSDPMDDFLLPIAASKALFGIKIEFMTRLFFPFNRLLKENYKQDNGEE